MKNCILLCFNSTVEDNSPSWRKGSTHVYGLWPGPGLLRWLCRRLRRSFRWCQCSQTWWVTVESNKWSLSSYTLLVQSLNNIKLSPISGHFCGNKVPKPVLSSNNEMVVRFKSDSSHNAKGFSAVYTVASAPAITTTTTTKPITTTSTRPSTTPEPTGECWTYFLNWFLGNSNSTWITMH